MKRRLLHSIIPMENDVLLGRGGKNCLYTGNQQLRELAKEVRETYQRSSKKEKSRMSRDLVRDIRTLDPPGRFLKRHEISMEWVEVTDTSARLKTSQALRDVATTRKLRNSRKKDDSKNDSTLEVINTEESSRHDRDARESPSVNCYRENKMKFQEYDCSSPSKSKSKPNDRNAREALSSSSYTEKKRKSQEYDCGSSSKPKSNPDNEACKDETIHQKSIATRKREKLGRKNTSLSTKKVSPEETKSESNIDLHKIQVKKLQRRCSLQHVIPISPPDQHAFFLSRHSYAPSNNIRKSNEEENRHIQIDPCQKLYLPISIHQDFYSKNISSTPIDQVIRSKKNEPFNYVQPDSAFSFAGRQHLQPMVQHKVFLPPGIQQDTYLLMDPIQSCHRQHASHYENLSNQELKSVHSSSHESIDNQSAPLFQSPSFHENSITIENLPCHSSEGVIQSGSFSLLNNDDSTSSSCKYLSGSTGIEDSTDDFDLLKEKLLESDILSTTNESVEEHWDE